jgi:hypothetical protein
MEVHRLLLFLAGIISLAICQHSGREKKKGSSKEQTGIPGSINSLALVFEQYRNYKEIERYIGGRSI